jgi:hypothetical protein
MEYHYEDSEAIQHEEETIIDNQQQRTLMRFLRLLEVSKRDVARFTRKAKDVVLKYGSLSEENLLTVQQLRLAEANHQRILAQFREATRAL